MFPRLNGSATSSGDPGKRVSNGTVETMLNHKEGQVIYITVSLCQISIQRSSGGPLLVKLVPLTSRVITLIIFIVNIILARSRDPDIVIIIITIIIIMMITIIRSRDPDTGSTRPTSLMTVMISHRSLET